MNYYELLLHACALVGVSILSILAWPRLKSIRWDSPLYKWLVAVTLCCSWMFAFTTSLLSSVPPEGHICRAIILLCATLYGVFKIFVYMFLIERLHLIAIKGPRCSNPTYLISLCLLIPFLVVVVLCVLYPVGYLAADGCSIGLLKESAVPLVVYDTFFGLFQMALFASIMCRYISGTGPNNDMQTAILRRALKIAFVGSSAAFFLSFINTLTLTLQEALHAHLCLSLCVLDVVGNACIMVYLVQPINPSFVCSNGTDAGLQVASGSLKNLPNAPSKCSSEEEYEHELQTVADMLKRMRAHGGREQTREPTTSSVSVEVGFSVSDDSMLLGHPVGMQVI